MATPTEKNPISTFKSWLFPSLVAILGWMIKSDINEMKSDVKVLLAQSNIDKTKIETLEKNVEALNKAVFNIAQTTPSSSRERGDSTFIFAKMVYGKPEEFYDIKKHLNIFKN
jgi:hypothetical protein